MIIVVQVFLSSLRFSLFNLDGRRDKLRRNSSEPYIVIVVSSPSFGQNSVSISTTLFHRSIALFQPSAVWKVFRWSATSARTSTNSSNAGVLQFDMKGAAALLEPTLEV